MYDSYEWNENSHIDCEDEYENVDPINEKLGLLILRYQDVMEYCWKSQKEAYKPLEAYLSRVFGTQEEMYAFTVFDEPPKLDEEELNRYYERYYMHNVIEVVEMAENEQLSL